MLVQSHERFDEVAEFDPQSGALRPMPRPKGMQPADADGWFGTLAGDSVVFFRDSGRLWLRVGDRTFDLDGGASVDWRLEGDMAVFTVRDEEGERVLKYRPRPVSGPPLSKDPTPFADDEDWDLGLFIANVSFDEERRELVRRGTK